MNNQKRPIAIIPARGGSKRIPGKNIKFFFGRPLISYSIELARNSGIFERIIVSTDNEDIRDIAIKWGAEVPFIRPSHLSGDYVSTPPVLAHALKEVFGKKKLYPHFFGCIYPTAPLLDPTDIKRGFDLLKKSNAGMVFTVTSFPSPILRSLHIDKKGLLKMNWPEHEKTRSQDLEQSYYDAGQFYLYRTQEFLSGRSPYDQGAVPVILPRHRVQDINTPEDWEQLEVLYKCNKMATIFH